MRERIKFLYNTDSVVGLSPQPLIEFLILSILAANNGNGNFFYAFIIVLPVFLFTETIVEW